MGHMCVRGNSGVEVHGRNTVLVGGGCRGVRGVRVMVEMCKVGLVLQRVWENNRSIGVEGEQW